MWVDRYVSANDAIILAQNEMGDDWGGEVPIFETWIKSAIEKIDGKYSFDDKVEVVKLEDQKFLKLNCDVVQVKALIQGHQKEFCLDMINNNQGIRNIPEYIPGDGDFGNGFLFIDHGSQNKYFKNCNWQILRGNLCFEKVQSATEFTVWSKSHKRDANGDLLIKQTDLEAAASYILLQAARRTRWGKKDMRMDKGDIQSFENRWAINLGNARAQQSIRKR